MKVSRSTIYSAFALIVTTLLLSACSTAALRLGVDDNGTQIELKKDQLLEIALPANVTTGFSWEVNQNNGALLAIQGDPAYEEAQPGRMGGGGTILFTFKAVDAGTLNLELVYHQAWDTETPPADTYSIEITIK